jgi:hypothetical protein
VYGLEVFEEREVAREVEIDWAPQPRKKKDKKSGAFNWD